MCVHLVATVCQEWFIYQHSSSLADKMFWHAHYSRWYLKGTVNFGILYTKQKSMNFIAYSDADWAGDPDDHKSTSGYLFQMCGGAVSWRSKKQSSVVLSTAEAEYIALASTAQEAVWLRQLTTELGSGLTEATTIFEDNQAAISMSKNPQYHGRAKHISIKYHFIREQVNNGIVTLKYYLTRDMLVDMLTKGLHRDQFMKLRKMHHTLYGCPMVFGWLS